MKKQQFIFPFPFPWFNYKLFSVISTKGMQLATRYKLDALEGLNFPRGSNYSLFLLFLYLSLSLSLIALLQSKLCPLDDTQTHVEHESVHL